MSRLSLAIGLMVGLSIFGCQDEIDPIIIVEEDAIQPGSELSKLILNVASLDGSEDNIVDRCSCTKVVFPVAGVFEDKVVTFASLPEVIALGAEALEVEWTFPMDVALPNHRQRKLANQEELEQIKDDCVEGGGDPDIECVDFLYPIVLSVFNKLTEKVSTETARSDKDFYRVFENPEAVVSIEYPISMIDAENISALVSNNEELTNLIRGAEGTCDEHDINEFDEPVLIDLELYLLSVSWQIALFEDSVNKTEQYSGITIKFNSDLSMVASGTEDEVYGEWEIDSYDGRTFLEFYFDTDELLFTDLNSCWQVTDFNEKTINMVAENDEDTTVKKLRLEGL